MRFILSMLCLFTLGLGILTACQKMAAPPTRIEAAKTDTNQAAAPKADENQDDAPRIALADAKADYDSRKAIFVDTRSAEAYKLEHVKGAINLPLADFDARYQELSSAKKIIAYCS